MNENGNGELLKNISEIMGSKVTGTPYTIIGNKVFSGYDYENSKGRFKGAMSIILNMVMKIRLENIFLRYLYLVMK